MEEIGGKNNNLINFNRIEQKQLIKSYRINKIGIKLTNTKGKFKY